MNTGRLFCACNPADSCEVCAGMPGAVPKFNEESVKAVHKTAAAFGCKLSKEVSFFRRISRTSFSRFSSPVGINGILKDAGIKISEIRLEESSGDSLCVIGMENRNHADQLKAALSYLGIYENTPVEVMNDDYQGIPEPLLATAPLAAMDFKIPEFSWQKISRWIKLGMDERDARQLAADPHLAAAFDKIPDDQLVEYSGFFSRSVCGALRLADIAFSESNLSPDALFRIYSMLKSSEISEREAQNMINELITRPREGSIIIGRKPVMKIADEQTLMSFIDKVVADNSTLVIEWRAGHDTLATLMTKVMTESRGKADPSMVRALLEKRLARGA